MSAPAIRAVALDLGSTHIKAGHLSADGCVHVLRRLPAPASRRHGERWESDPAAWERAAGRLLRLVTKGLPAGVPLGLASQRSSFLLWRRRDGLPVTPVIAWQDRRAADWLARHADGAALARRPTGLVLTAHHVGPKLAALQEEDPGLGSALRRDELLFGTLETYLVWRWSDGAVHVTDPGMAARTGLMDLERGDWSGDMLDLFGVPPAALPEIGSTTGRRDRLPAGVMLTVSGADQALCAASVLAHDDAAVLVNAGTGTFVLGPPCPPHHRRPGYLTSLLPAAGGATPRGLLEGPIHAGIPADWMAPAGGRFADEDALPGIFCLPDRAGVGAPHWRAGDGPALSARVPPAHRAQVAVEGLLFRVTEVLADLLPAAPTGRLVLAPGGGRTAAVAGALATLLARPVEVANDPEPTLAATLRLAAGAAAGDGTGAAISPGGGAYLMAKRQAWTAWMERRLARSEQEA